MRLGGGGGSAFGPAPFPLGGVGAAKGLLPCFLVPKGNQPTACTLALWWLKFGPTENFGGGGQFGGGPAGGRGGGSCRGSGGRVFLPGVGWGVWPGVRGARPARGEGGWLGLGLRLGLGLA